MSNLSNIQILVIEDDHDAQEILKMHLESEGAEVLITGDGLAGVQAFKEATPDLILLDMMLPKLDGWEVLSLIRPHNIPIIAITAQDSTDEIVKGLSGGLDDYITKPFRLREVSARIDAVLRRTTAGDGDGSLQLGDIFIDDQKKQVTIGSREIHLAPKEYSLLKTLAEQPGRVYSEQELIDSVWPEGGLATSSDVKRYIYLLRKKVEEDPQEPHFIQTVRGFGYKLEY